MVRDFPSPVNATFLRAGNPIRSHMGAAGDHIPRSQAQEFVFGTTVIGVRPAEPPQIQCMMSRQGWNLPR